jgi:deazaflavin-dependent oxidoreductase (nitroreductase family)
MTDDSAERPRSEKLFFDPAAMKAFNDDFVGQARANNGQILSGPLAGSDAIVLTITGAKTGRALVTPLVYTRDGDRMVIAASKGGAPEHPSWYHNLVANPEATAEVGGETFQVRAHEVHGEERERLFAAHAARMPQFDKYQARTERLIPVLVLERI